MEANLDDLKAILQWMVGQGLRLFRIGSSLVPLASHPVLRESGLDWEAMAGARLKSIGRRYGRAGFRFSLHPGQYAVLNSRTPAVAAAALEEVRYSCRVLDLMELDSSHKVVVHGGCVCGDREASLALLEAVLAALPPEISRRLVLENDEKFSYAELLPLSEATGTPVVFDSFHDTLRPSPDIGSLLLRGVKVWDCRPKVHVSSQRQGARAGAHGDFVSEEDLLRLDALPPIGVDLMIEAKAKEAAALEARAVLLRHGMLVQD